MSREGIRFMWVLVFFDLPVTEKPQRKRAAQFRKFLKRDGYIMLQWSVYARMCNGQEGVEKHIKRLRIELPCDGNIRTMQITDQQYSRIQILVGKKPICEDKNSARQLTLF